jgi:hypothetical protein
LRRAHLFLCHSGAREARPGIDNHHREYGFPDVQLHIRGLRQVAHPGMTVLIFPARFLICLAARLQALMLHTAV